MIYLIVLGIAFIIASYTDIKTMEIPLWVFPGVFIIRVILGIILKNPITIENWLGMAIMGISFLILCFAGKMGGGDLIMFSVTGFILGYDNLISYVICLSILTVAVLFIKKIKWKEWFPVAPAAASAFFIFCVFKRAGFF